MQVMTKQTKELNVYDLSYPCYVAGIPEDSQQIAHIPGHFEYQSLDQTYGYVLEGYKTKDTIFLFDCIPLNLWHKKVCLMEYYKRLRHLRRIIVGEIADFKKVIDLPMVECQTPIDAIDYLDNLLTSGFKKARIMSANGYYIFGEAVDGEFVEIEL